jgi:hypothetical protein
MKQKYFIFVTKIIALVFFTGGLLEAAAAKSRAKSCKIVPLKARSVVKADTIFSGTVVEFFYKHKNSADLWRRRKRGNYDSRQFWVHFGSILGPFWVHFGSILGPFWVHFGAIFGQFLSPAYGQRQSTLDCRYLTLLCDNLKNNTSRSKNDVLRF